MPNYNQVTNYPLGHPYGVTMRNVPMIGMHSSSRVFWVYSVSGQNSGKGTYVKPFATLAYAVSQCQASQGDTIFIKAGHAETLTTAAAIAINIAGIEIIGLGQGTERPTFTFATSTAATITITAAGVTWRNCVITNTLDQVVSPIVISAANCTLDSLEFQDSATNVEFVTGILTTAGAAKLQIKNLRYMGQTGGSHCATPIKLVGVVEAIIDINFYGKASTAVVNFATTACAGIRVTGAMYNSGTINGSKNVVDTVGGSTWWADLFDGAAGYKMDGGSASALAFADPSVGDKSAISSQVGVLTTGMTLFTIAGGPIELLALMSMCTTGADATAATLLYTTIPTGLAAVPISTASGSIANAPVNATIAWQGTLGSACVYASGGTQATAGSVTATAALIPPGVINATIGSGPTVTGTWKHYIRYRPMGPGITVV